jgi:hypothetical protein
MVNNIVGRSKKLADFFTEGFYKFPESGCCKPAVARPPIKMPLHRNEGIEITFLASGEIPARFSEPVTVSLIGFAG